MLLLAIAALGAVAWLELVPYGPTSPTFVQIAPRSSTLRIGRELEMAGVVRSQYAFDALRLVKHGFLRAGEYRFDHPAPATEVYARIARGDVYTVALTVPEGATIFEIAAIGRRAGLADR